MEWGWALDGIKPDIPRTSGPECSGYMTNQRRIIEAIIVSAVLCFILKCVIKRLEPITVSVPERRRQSLGGSTCCSCTKQHCFNNDESLMLIQNTSATNTTINSTNTNTNINQPPSHIPSNVGLQESTSTTITLTIRYILLITMTFVFGMEMGFKFAEKTVIFALNPCHLQTIVQIYLLAATKPSKVSTVLFRLQMSFLNGPVLAYVFPEVETRLFNLEQFTYWVQHALLFIIPIYLLKTGIYESEDLLNFKWCIIGYCIMLLYHFILLNGVSIISGINLNHMLCPALADPFQGDNYRLAAIVHESILCPILNKLTVFLFAVSKVTTTYPSSNNDKKIVDSKAQQRYQQQKEGIMTTKID